MTAPGLVVRRGARPARLSRCRHTSYRHDLPPPWPTKKAGAGHTPRPCSLGLMPPLRVHTSGWSRGRQCCRLRFPCLPLVLAKDLRTGTLALAPPCTALQCSKWVRRIGILEWRRPALRWPCRASTPSRPRPRGIQRRRRAHLLWASQWASRHHRTRSPTFTCPRIVTGTTRAPPLPPLPRQPLRRVPPRPRHRLLRRFRPKRRLSPRSRHSRASQVRRTYHR